MPRRSPGTPRGLTKPPSPSRLKEICFTVRASREDARRWARVARYLGCRSVAAWLEEIGEEQARRVEELIPPERE